MRNDIIIGAFQRTLPATGCKKMRLSHFGCQQAKNLPRLNRGSISAEELLQLLVAYKAQNACLGWAGSLAHVILFTSYY
jgi:hypothetical protein